MDHQHIHWLGHSSVRIEDGGRQIYFDPWKLPDGLPKADVVFLSHAHYDHYSPQDIAKIGTPKTVYVATKDVAASLKGEIRIVGPGEVHEVAGLRVETIAAYNLGKQFHPKQNNWVGYCVTLTTGQRIYHAGDTDATPEMRKIVCDIALLPCGGNYTMSAREAAAAANVFKPGAVIPIHWGDIVGSKEDAEEFRRGFKGETIIKAVERKP